MPHVNWSRLRFLFRHAWCASKSESKVDPKFQATFQFLKKSEEKYVVGILAVLDMSNTIRTPGTHATYALTPLEVRDKDSHNGSE